MMLQVSEQCIHCGRCVAVCPSMIIEMDDASRPFIREKREKGCIVCGHCVSVCPVGALDHRLSPLSGQVELSSFPVVDFETTEQLLRSVRSIRNYKPDSVSPSLIRQIAHLAHYVPTGRNTQGVSFLALMDSAKVRLLSDKVVDWMSAMIDSGAEWAKVYKGVVRVQRETGRDMIFRGAPHLLFALSDRSNPYGVDNARLGMVYARIAASSLKIGSCWAGFFELYAQSHSEYLSDFLGFPAHKVIGAAIMIGYPQFTYHRLVERRPLEIEFI